MTKAQLAAFLSRDDVIARVVRRFGELEWLLNLLLTRYFTAQDRFWEFADLIVDRLSVSEKIEIVRAMRFHRPLKSQANLVRSLEKLRKLRNALAHGDSLRCDRLHRLHSDNEIMKLLSGWPGLYDREIVANKNRMNR